MFVHSYQSYLWNAATSERCKRFGTETAVEGDLVLKDAAVAVATNGNSTGKLMHAVCVDSKMSHCFWGNGACPPTAVAVCIRPQVLVHLSGKHYLAVALTTQEKSKAQQGCC